MTLKKYLENYYKNLNEDKDEYLDFCWNKERMLEEMIKKIKQGERDIYLKKWLLDHGKFINRKDKKEIEKNNKEIIRKHALKNLNWLFSFEYYNGYYKKRNGLFAIIKDLWGFHELEDYYKKLRDIYD